MIQINLNVIGTPTGLIELKIDTSTTVHLARVEGQRAIFELSDSTSPHGFTVRWLDKSARSVIPSLPGSYEGSLLNPPLPDLVFIVIPFGLRIEGDHFLLGNKRFLVCGSTDFRLPERVMNGSDIKPIIDDRMSCGCNWFRILTMKKNNTGYELNPHDSRHSDAMKKMLDIIGNKGAYCQYCIFADTKDMMKNPSEQQNYYSKQRELLQPYKSFTLPEFCNEASHSTQDISPNSFAKWSEFLMSHGSETADKFPVRPLWNWAGYSARRSGVIGKVISNYSQLTAFEQWPPVCLVPQETIKPEGYAFNPVVAKTLGKYARAGTGGVFHHNAWRESRLFNSSERACAIAFYEGIND